MSISESEKTKERNVRGAMISCNICQCHISNRPRIAVSEESTERERTLAHIDAGLVSAMIAATGSRSGLLGLLGESGLIVEAGMVISFVAVSVFASVIRGDGLPSSAFER